MNHFLKSTIDWYKIMRVTLSQLIIVMVFTGISLAENSKAQEVLDTKVTIRAERISLVDVLKQLEKKADVKFVYSPNIISGGQTVSIAAHGSRLKQVLDKLLLPNNISYEVINKRIVLGPMDKKKMPAPKRFANGLFGDNLLSKVQDSLITVKGRVFDTHEPPQGLPGVSIAVKNQQIGTSTDIDGYFAIEVPQNTTLVFSMIGFEQKEFLITKPEDNLIVALLANVADLEQVVVVGLTEQQKKHIASSLSTLDVSSNIKGKPITSLSQALQGGVTGIDVQQGSGLPGGDAATIKIRGITTLNNSDPLVLVDGVPMDMNHVNPVTVESVTVLKDAAAAAIYGARAANGVILITTKRGAPGKVTVSYDGYVGVQSPNIMPEFVDAPTYMRMYNYAQVASGGQPFYSDEVIGKTISGEDPIRYPNTNWAEQVIDEYTPITSHSLSVSGGNEIARFAVTANYIFQDGMIPVNKMDRFNIRANTSISLAEKLLVYLDVLTIKRNTLYPNRPLSNGGSRILDDMYRLPPTVIPKYPQEEGEPLMYGRYADIVNPVAYAEQGGSLKYEYVQSSINLQPRWEVFPNFNLRGQFSFRLNSDVYKATRDNFYFFDYYTDQLVQTWNLQRTSYSKVRDTYYYLSGSGDYTFKANNHRLFAMAGYGMESFHNGYWNISSLLSGYAKVNYSYNDTYLIESSMRVDGSSKFGPDHKFGYFPSVALGWNVHNESFMENVDWLSSLKLRASYGLLGNESIGLYQYQNLIRESDGVETDWGNPDITWETVNMLDLGVDIGLLADNRLHLTFDYYNKVTNDIILKPTVSYVGAVGSASINAGKVRNRGYELVLDYNQKVNRNVDISIRPGFSYNKNEILELTGGPFISGIRIHDVGYPIGSHYGYKTQGLLQASDFGSDGTAKVPIVPGEGPGDIQYVDLNGDNLIDDGDQSVIGNPTPKLNYFTNISLRWKKLDLEFLIQGSGKSDYSANLGGKSSGYLWHPLNFSASGGVPTTYRAANTWRPNNTGALYPRLLANPAVNILRSNYWLFNAAYLRMKFIQLGYRFDGDFLQKAGISSARLYINAQNPFIVSDMVLADPESRGGSYTYGIMKTFTIGAHINF